MVPPASGPCWPPNWAMVAKARAISAAVLLALAAQANAQEQQTFKAIPGTGSEIKSVTFAKGEATENREVFLVTLQKEKSVAVCYFAAPNCISPSNTTL